jgi:hypothetical protein
MSSHRIPSNTGRIITVYELSHEGASLGFFPTKKSCRDAAVARFERTGQPLQWRDHTIADNSAGVCELANAALSMEKYQ